MKVIVFGATPSAKKEYDDIIKHYDIVAYCDNDSGKWNQYLNNVKIISPQDIFKYQWDEIIIISLSSAYIIKKQLLGMGIPNAQINISYVEYKIRARENFVRDFASVINKENMSEEFCVAEAGVFQGEFAKVINESFPNQKLYLFDTFEGFDERDVIFEKQNNYSDAAKGHLNITSELWVLAKMKYPEVCIIRKGHFPESAKGIKEVFGFVNLDMDLYKPTLEGLRFFYPLMIQGGIIMVHDFFSQGYEGVNAALREFIEETDDQIIPFPIGDHVSIAIQKR